LLHCILTNCLEGLLNIYGFLGGSLKVWNIAFGLAPRKGSLLSDNALILQVNLVAQNNKREVIGIAWSGLNEELITPAIKVFKCLCDIDIENENTTISTTIECDTQALETFLACSIPNLHRNQSLINHDFFC